MTKKQVRDAAFRIFSSINQDIRTKMNNVCGKTGQYNVPDELFQKRTSRTNRVLISWKSVKNNNLTIEQLATFSGGVTVEFINEDYFDEENQNNPVFIELKNRIGSDDVVSSIITIRSESGSSSSAVQREYFEKLIDNTEITYKGETVVINKENYKDFALTKLASGGMGNEKWSGFLYVSIRGGQQDVIQSHTSEQTIFNPACEYANQDVCLELDLVMAYFALKSFDNETKVSIGIDRYNEVVDNIELYLRESYYDSESYSGNLYDYCVNHITLRVVEGELYDPIQFEKINIMDFAIKNKQDYRNIDFTHNEAVLFEKYYWDNEKQCILSPARPANVFWSRHLSNMMQQNFSLDEYFDNQERIIKRRKELMN